MSTPSAQLPSRYLDAEPIGRGGMGEIYRATDAELGRAVVVKVLSEHYAQDEALRQRFRREALAAARLSSNPNIVTIFDVGEQDGRPMIVMEYLPGGSLADRLRRGAPIPTDQALAWLEQAATALDAAHDAGVVHRDIKPGNLLLDERNQVHVADFGVASATGLDSFTKTGTILGTAGYMSPEQAMGRRATPASDRYALAVVAWELLTGRRPFASPNPTSEAAAHANAPIPSIRAANPRLPGALERVFQRALAKAPEVRHETAAELVADLRRALRDGADGDGWPTRILAPPPPPPRVARGGRRWWVPFLLVLLAGAGALAAYLGTQAGSKHGAPRAERTVVRTVTGPGTTVQQTVTAPQATQPTGSPATPSTAAGAALNDAGYLRMQAGDYVGALPLLQQAVQRLQGTGVIDEAYADYNLAFTRFALGDCTDVLVLLDQAQSIEGHKRPIDDLRKQAHKTCGKRG